MKKKLWIILAVGILLRVILSLITYHPDIQIFDLSGQILKTGNILTIYDYLYTLEEDNVMVKNFPSYALNYPPAAYFLLGGLSLILTSLIPSSVHMDFLFNTQNTLGNIFLNLHLLALKLPYFIFDLGCAFLLFKLFDDFKKKMLAFTLWMFNPLTLYVTFMMGQYDIIPTFFTIASLYMVKKAKESSLKSLLWAAIFLGIGTAFKIYPILFIIPLAALAKSWLQRLSIVVAGLIPYILTILPFLQSPGFRTNALLANQLNKSFFPQIPVSGGESILLFLASLIFVYLIFLHQKLEKNNLWQYFFIIILLFFIFTHFHPQWFLWLTPFLIIEAVFTKFKNIFVTALMLLSWFSLLFFFDSSLSIGLFSPINPQLYQGENLWHLIGISLDFNLLRSVFHTLIAGSAIYFIFSYFPRKLPDSA